MFRAIELCPKCATSNNFNKLLSDHLNDDDYRKSRLNNITFSDDTGIDKWVESLATGIIDCYNGSTQTTVTYDVIANTILDNLRAYVGDIVTRYGYCPVMISTDSVMSRFVSQAKTFLGVK